MSQKVRLGINGLGRIGRALIRLWAESQPSEYEIVAVNNPGDAKTYTHLLKYDSCHGVFPGNFSLEDSYLTVNNSRLKFFQERDPKLIAWDQENVDIVIDCTGKFKDVESLDKHRRGSVQKVIMCAPGKDLHGTFVMGVNHQNYDPKNHHIISIASCTTNCLAPVAKVLHDQFGIEAGCMTTIHSYTLDQRLLDASHEDLRRGRAAALSMIPTSTGAAKSIGDVIPELKGKLDGMAMRVPTPDVSLVDLTVQLSKPVSVDTINQKMYDAAEGELKGILAYNTLPLVSIDFMGRKESSVYDSTLTLVIGQTAKITSWYDNEIGFSQRVLDLAQYVGEKLS